MSKMSGTTGTSDQKRKRRSLGIGIASVFVCVGVFSVCAVLGRAWRESSDSSVTEPLSTLPPAASLVIPSATLPLAMPSDEPTPSSSPSPTVPGEYWGQLPDGFIYLIREVPDLSVFLMYASSENFTGGIVPGYFDPLAAVATQETADALNRAMETLKPLGLGLKIYDAYRPQTAVKAFLAWRTAPEDDIVKQMFYPNFTREELFTKGYIASNSPHSKGSTLDLTLVSLDTGLELPMGGRVDLLDSISHHGAAGLTEEETNNRKLLKQTLEAAGFSAYSKEWWHYTLRKEPFSQTFDFSMTGQP